MGLLAESYRAADRINPHPARGWPVLFSQSLSQVPVGPGNGRPSPGWCPAASRSPLLSLGGCCTGYGRPLLYYHRVASPSSPVTPRTFSLWSRIQKNTHCREAGDTHNLMTANPSTKLYTPPAFLVTNTFRVAILFLPSMPVDTGNDPTVSSYPH